MSIGRITGGISTRFNPFGPSIFREPPSTHQILSPKEQVENALFSGKHGQELEIGDFLEIEKTFLALKTYLHKFILFSGDSPADYRLKLSEGATAMIDSAGTIFFGISFLRAYSNQEEVLVGALAHEIGHRPKRWVEYSSSRRFNTKDLLELCRFEETRADFFAGRALAEVELSVEPMIAFLLCNEQGGHPKYFPAKMRAEVIREGFNMQSSFKEKRKRLWPELEKLRSLKFHLGDF